ncbi:MAG: hypothetical protein QXR60_03805 [Candidatus Nanoarchaeia archaeon]
MKIRKPASSEDVIFPVRKKSWNDFLVWLSTSNEAFRFVMQLIITIPLVFFGIGAVLCYLKGWKTISFISSVFFVFSAYNFWVRKDLAFRKSGASILGMVSGKYGGTYEELAEKKDEWSEVFENGKEE